MALTVLYFARLRESLRLAREEIALPATLGNVGQLLDFLRARGAVWQDVLGDAKTVRVAVNQDLAANDTPIKDGDEVALFPPVTGG